MGLRQATAGVLENLGLIAKRHQEYGPARSNFEEALGIWREVWNPFKVAWTLINLGNAAYEHGMYPLARRSYEESRELFQSIDNPLGVACAVNTIGTVLHQLGDAAAAQLLHREALALYQTFGSAEGMAWSLERLGITETALGNSRRAARLLGAASVVREQCVLPLTPPDKADLDRAMVSLRGTLGTVDLECAWAAGRRMAGEEAIAEAVSDLALPEGTGA